MPVLVELVKIAALAAAVAMILTYLLPAFVAAIMGVLVLYLLTVKAS